MDVKIVVENNNNNKIDSIRLQKMLLVFNALEEGWTIKKRRGSFIFTKNHEGKKEIFHESYLRKFMETNFDLNKLLS